MGYTITNSSIESAAQGIFMSALCWPTVGRPLAKCRPTVKFGNYSLLLHNIFTWFKNCIFPKRSHYTITIARNAVRNNKSNNA